MNRILSDLIYGANNRLFNEFIYDYENIPSHQLRSVLQLIVEQI